MDVNRGGVLLLAACVCMVLLCGCESGEPVRIGFLAGTSGRVADLGLSGQDAVQLLVDEVNRNGGINGRRILLISRDDRQDAQTARQAVRELAREGVVAIVGPMTSDMAIAVLPVLEELKLTAISPTVSSDALSGLDDQFFRITAPTRLNAARCAQYHVDHTDLHHFVGVYDLNNRVYSQSWLENFRQEFVRTGRTFSLSLGFDANDQHSFSNLADKVLEERPEAVLMVSNSMDAAVLCQQIRKKGSQVQIAIADWGATERLLELGGSAVEGAIVAQTFIREDSSKPYQDFRKIYLQRFGREPGFPGVYAYDAASILVDVLRRQQKGQTVKDALRDQPAFQGLQNEIVLDRFGDVTQSHVSISVVRDGTFKILE